MYKLPEDINDDFLQGEVVKMVCFNLNQIYIHFQSSIQICIEGQYSLVNRKGEKIYFDVHPVLNDNGLLQILEKEVKGVEISKSRTDFSIQFQDGVLLEIIGNCLYESYSIKLNERTIIV